MKHACLLVLLFISFSVNSQSKLKIKMISPLISDIEKVARDYYQNFENIRGEKLSETTNIVEYASTINPKGSLESTIMQIKSLENTYSWQTLMLDTESFTDASKKYKELYQQLNGARLELEDGKAYKIQGMYDVPDESRAFASSLLELKGVTQNPQHFTVEVALNYAMPEWSVKLYVYEKVNDEDMRPTVSSDY